MDPLSDPISTLIDRALTKDRDAASLDAHW
jgi:hypothetical protein